MRNADDVTAMLCPLCKVGLAMSDRQGIEIDYCPQCRGVWLDRGELDKIIERSGGADPAPAQAIPAATPAPSPWAGDRGHDQRGYGQQGYGQQGYDQRGHDPRYRHGKRKKSFLEELFD